ncbi:hypothetical protein SAMN02746041_01004 [Desulfacinum hydrothermale DSM 13146]|uniref:Spermatogenesis-associated protein 20-like TRX domain-containing protein n=1 Tax=Desulfacinum hydrothermale DSM 13146 TaxID=1121390 RepID=A0A1W1XA92_9BACT|nr:thioredoxin domain-containing protein [Desulfacinum hydrothermale]SMC20740.1 hypothetical protein SAMN02746041_01004 [Desulfacinum hydrothermale DSM 13146]
MPNHLAGEKSPYLLQHVNNPVDWYPWGKEAFARAREEDKPIFLSIGYATCHWCHVMAHESFEDEEVARLLNAHFVAVKVDREERPDIDGIYMTACQAMTGGGGWPLSVFLTPEGKPFFAGTYFPKASRMGMPGFVDILQEIARLWKEERDRVLQTGLKIAEALERTVETTGDGQLTHRDLQRAYEQLRSAYDERWGGFGPPPKFPTPHNLTFLLRFYDRSQERSAVSMVDETLQAMRRGGIYDHLGYGFHRYSVDERWLVPHFEKMLYDQALLAMAYLEAYHVTGRDRHGRTAEEIFAYVLRDMTAPQGGFYSAEDADTEGEEGLFYTWTPEEVREVLDADLASLFCYRYGVTVQGNFEKGRSILHEAKTLEECAERFSLSLQGVEERLGAARKALFEKRRERVPPLKDDKILTAWNGLMAAALAKGAWILHKAEYAEAAARAVRFVWDHLRDSGGRLQRRYRDGQVAHRGCLDDYAFLGWALLELYEATLEADWLDKAVELHDGLLDLFGDFDRGGFFFTGRDAEQLIFREKDHYDGATPSGNSAALNNLVRLAGLTGDARWEEAADGVLRAFAETVAHYPRAYTHFLTGLDWALGPSTEIVLVGDRQDSDLQHMIRIVRRAGNPRRVLLLKEPPPRGETLERLVPFVRPMEALAGRATAYVCETRRCLRPVTEPEALKRLLDGMDKEKKR